MKLHKLELLSFKNIETASCLFANKINCFLGDNGMGKTNLIDAIHYLSMLKSHIGSTDKESIYNDRDEALLWGTYLYDNTENFDPDTDQSITASLKITQSHTKRLHVNGKNYPKISDHIGKIPIVVVSPQDHKIIRGNSEERRRFVDRLLSQKDPVYLNYLIQYTRALGQRNLLLRNKIYDPTLMDYLEELLARYGVAIQKARVDFLENFVPIFEEIYRYISGGDEAVSLCYRSSFNDQDKESYKTTLQQKRRSEEEYGYTTIGIHRDDLEMLVCNRPVRKSGSEGQNKTFLVALKMAEFDFLLQSDPSNKPLLLLDDVFDKLDAHRVEHIIEWVSEDHFGQIFITDTNRKYLDEIIRRQNADYKLFSVKKGVVEEMENLR